MAEHKSGLALTKDTPYLALAGELWGVYCDEFSEYWSSYNGIALYQQKPHYLCLNVLYDYNLAVCGLETYTVYQKAYIVRHIWQKLSVDKAI